tara:strand:- start:2811 stop:3452 length:642 start_codon:yes stop_codon:yes gene_type:complete
MNRPIPLFAWSIGGTIDESIVKLDRFLDKKVPELMDVVTTRARSEVPELVQLAMQNADISGAAAAATEAALKIIRGQVAELSREAAREAAEGALSNEQLKGALATVNVAGDLLRDAETRLPAIAAATARAVASELIGNEFQGSKGAELLKESVELAVDAALVKLSEEAPKIVRQAITETQPVVNEMRVVMIALAASMMFFALALFYRSWKTKK